MNPHGRYYAQWHTQRGWRGGKSPKVHYVLTLGPCSDEMVFSWQDATSVSDLLAMDSLGERSVAVSLDLLLGAS